MADFSIYLSQADTLAAAIATAEGWPVLGSLPNRIHNPGDLELGDRGWGVEQKKTVYFKADFGAPLNDRSDGASALRRECLAILTGSSHVYSTSWTFDMLAKRWTGDDRADSWCKTVCEKIGSTPYSQISQWLKESA